MTRLAALLLIFVFTSATGSVAQNDAQNDAQTGNSRRLSNRDDLLGWEAVGRLELAGQGFCTATLIAADLILTAAHCAFDRQTGSLYPAEQITFRAGLRDGVSIADRQVDRIAVHPGFEPQGPPSPERVRHDVALMRLSEPITVAQADPFILYAGGFEGVEVSLASYGQGRADAISRQRACRIVRAVQGLMAFDCDVTFGSSGSAVFARVGNRGRIVSVVSGMMQIDGQKVAIGMALTDIVGDLKQQLRRTPPRSQTAPTRLKIGGWRRNTGAKFIRPGGG